MCSTHIQGPFCFTGLSHVSLAWISPSAGQPAVSRGLSLEGTAGFPQKLREAVAASYGQLEPVYGHSEILRWSPLPLPAAHKGKAASCKQQTAQWWLRR